MGLDLSPRPTPPPASKDASLVRVTPLTLLDISVEKYHKLKCYTVTLISVFVDSAVINSNPESVVLVA